MHETTMANLLVEDNELQDTTINPLLLDIVSKENFNFSYIYPSL